MQDMIAVVSNSSASNDELLAALQELQALVEPIDNANGELCMPRHG